MFVWYSSWENFFKKQLPDFRVQVLYLYSLKCDSYAKALFLYSHCTTGFIACGFYIYTGYWTGFPQS